MDAVCVVGTKVIRKLTWAGFINVCTDTNIIAVKYDQHEDVTIDIKHTLDFEFQVLIPQVSCELL